MNQQEQALKSILERIKRVEIKDFQAAALLVQITDDCLKGLTPPKSTLIQPVAGVLINHGRRP